MADKLRLGPEVRELKIGQSFTNPKSTAFHTLRYDFKPASVDINKIATVDVAKSNEVTVTVPHLDGAGVPQTVFKGSQRPYTKECVLVIDRATGEITLEKLSSNMQVKKTRSELAKPPLPQDRGNPSSERSGSSSLSSLRPQTPPIGQRTSSKTRVTSGSRRADRVITPLVPKHSPLHASPSYPSPGHYKSPKRDPHINNESHAQNALASLPSIGMDDYSDAPSHSHQPAEKSPNFRASDTENRVAQASDSSSSSSDSDSDSDHDNTVIRAEGSRTNGHMNGMHSSAGSASKIPMPVHILNEDLRLSESGSDSD